MTLNHIIETITANLTGDHAVDIPYLGEQIIAYQDHPLSTEVTRACQRLAMKVLPAEERSAFLQATKAQRQGYNAILSEAQFQISLGHHEAAGALLQDLIEQVEGIPYFTEDTENVYYTFDAHFQKILFRWYFKPEKEVRQASVPFSAIYLAYGLLLYDVSRFQEAYLAVQKARQWNPVSCRILFECVTVCRALNRPAEYLDTVIEAFQYAYHRDDLSECYHLLGYYFLSSHQYDTAMGCYLLSVDFDIDAGIPIRDLEEMLYACSQSGKAPSSDHVMDAAQAYNFPYGPHHDVIGVANAAGFISAEAEDYDEARYFWQIAYVLTGNKDFKEQIDALPDATN